MLLGQYSTTSNQFSRIKTAVSQVMRRSIYSRGARDALAGEESNGTGTANSLAQVAGS